jgi:hypothetical protein
MEDRGWKIAGVAGGAFSREAKPSVVSVEAATTEQLTCISHQP